jgi:hypothetical protein
VTYIKYHQVSTRETSEFSPKNRRLFRLNPSDNARLTLVRFDKEWPFFIPYWCPRLIVQPTDLSNFTVLPHLLFALEFLASSICSRAPFTTSHKAAQFVNELPPLLGFWDEYPKTWTEECDCYTYRVSYRLVSFQKWKKHEPFPDYASFNTNEHILHKWADEPLEPSRWNGIAWILATVPRSSKCLEHTCSTYSRMCTLNRLIARQYLHDWFRHKWGAAELVSLSDLRKIWSRSLVDKGNEFSRVGWWNWIIWRRWNWRLTPEEPVTFQ